MLMGLKRQTQIMYDLLDQVAPGQPSPFAPNGQWPNPTEHIEFPRVDLTANGWEVITGWNLNAPPQPH
jgi:hypothetical protein